MTCNQSLNLPGLPGLAQLAAAIQALTQRIEAMHEELTAFINRMDAATNAIAARLEKLTTDPQLPADIKARLEEEIAQLEAMGKDPADPLPTE
jgi:predicted  nucleic acid-binding Zn-ribbon protein